ncbi:MAG: ABC transporter permease [Bdellovibrionia bacterium]
MSFSSSSKISLNHSWKLSWRNLGRNRRRNLATGAAIAFGYAGLLLLGGYIVRVEHYLRVNSVYLNHSGHVSIYRKDGLERHLTKPSRYNLKPEEQARILELVSKDSEIEFIGKYLKGAGLAGNGCKSYPFLATGIDTSVEKTIHEHPEVIEWVPELNVSPELQSDSVALTSGLARLLGKPRVHSEVPQESRSVAQTQNCSSPDVSKDLAKDANIQLAGRTVHGDFSAVDAEITSHYSTGLALTEDSGLVAPLSMLQKLYDTDSVTYIALYLKPNVWVQSYLNRLNERLASTGLELSVYAYDSEDISPFYVGVVNFLLVMAGFFVFLVFGVVALSIINSLAMSIIERTREIGTLRSLGYSRESIAGLFARETLILSGISLASGWALAQAISWGVNSLNIRFEPPGIADTMQFMLKPSAPLCAGLAFVILILSYLTARQTAMIRTKQRVAELLTSGTG